MYRRILRENCGFDLYCNHIIFAVVMVCIGTCFGAELDPGGPSPFPNGSQILFSSAHERGWQLYSIAVDGTKLLRVTEGEDDKIQPSISPDGKVIAYVRWPKKSGAQIQSMPANGGNSVRLTRGDLSDRGPSFSPDGTRIVFLRAGRHRGYSFGGFVWDDWDVWRMKRDGTEQERLTNEKYYLADPPRFSPDGKRIIFAGRPHNATTKHIFLINADAKPDSRPIEVHFAPVKPPYDFCGDPSFSPDGSHIVFISTRVSRDSPYDYEIWSAKTDGTELRQVTHNHSFNIGPRYSPDGKSLYFLSDPRRDGKYELWRIDVDGSHPFKLFAPVVNK